MLVQDMHSAGACGVASWASSAGRNGPPGHRFAMRSGCAPTMRKFASRSAGCHAIGIVQCGQNPFNQTKRGRWPSHSRYASRLVTAEGGGPGSPQAFATRERSIFRLGGGISFENWVCMRSSRGRKRRDDDTGRVTGKQCFGQMNKRSVTYPPKATYPRVLAHLTYPIARQ